MSDFLRFHSPEKSHCSLSMETRAAARETWRCPGCGSPRIDFGPIDVVIQENWPDDEPNTFINGSSLGLARRDFLKTFGEANVRKDLVVGNVSTESGRNLNEWCTFYGRYPLVVRGSSHASYRVCHICSRTLYFAMGTQYLYPEPVKGGTIYDNGALLVTRAELVGGVDFGRWPGLRIERLKVFSKPKDGLGDF